MIGLHGNSAKAKLGYSETQGKGEMTIGRTIRELDG